MLLRACASRKCGRRVVKAASIRNERGQFESMARSHPGAAVIMTTEPRKRLGEIPPERDPQGETSGSESTPGRTVRG